jgi:RNA polymerase sigma-70 factor (ECF subfamily)
MNAPSKVDFGWKLTLVDVDVMPPLDPMQTSHTLLRLLALPEADAAWEVFIERYGPLINARCRRAGLQPADADDIRGAVLSQLVQALRTFRYDPARRFRGYLKQVVDNAIASYWRTIRMRPGWVGAGGDAGGELPGSLGELGAELDERIQEHAEEISRKLDRVRFEVGPAAWQAFWLTAVDGLSGAEAAARLGQTPAAVFMAKSRVLARLRAAAGRCGCE